MFRRFVFFCYVLYSGSFREREKLDLKVVLDVNCGRNIFLVL